MSMRLTLDRAAVASLFERDPEFEVEVHKTILAEVGRRLLVKDSDRLIKQLEPELFAKVLQSLQDDEDFSKLVRAALEKQLVIRIGSWGQNKTLSDDAKQVVEERVAQVKEQLLRSATAEIEAAFSSIVKEKVAEVLARDDLDARIERRVNLLVEQEIARRAEEKFKARLADLKAMMSC